MTAPRFDVTPFVLQDEGQHFDRKSLFEGPGGGKHRRDRRAVRNQVAEYVAAFANAEGGVLILGIEDGGTVSGHRYPDSAVRTILETPCVRLRPLQAEGFIVEHEGTPLLVFDVPASDVAVQVDGNGFPLRMGDRTVQASESQIQALKFRGMAESWEAQPSRAAMADLDAALLEQARRGSGLAALSDEEYLLKRKLVDRSGTSIVLRRAAELLFAANGPDHPNAGVRVFRVIGTERRLGVEHNVEEKPRIEGNLPFVVASTFTVVKSLIRRPSRLRGLRFQEMPEYPEFSWKEAVLNAIAHRDYSVEGRTTEVWFFDDRLEISSPGGLIGDLTLDELLRLERRHMSRNPRTVRTLVDLSIMRDQGEGIPRMFAEMEGLFLPAPGIEARPHEIIVTLRNTPTLTETDRAFVASLGLSEIGDVEFRALLEAYRRGRIDNARLRKMTGLDTLAASALLRRLRDRKLLTLHAAGAGSYYELGPGMQVESAPPDVAREGPDSPGPNRQGFGPNRQGLELDRQGFEARDPESSEDPSAGNLPADAAATIDALGDRPRKPQHRAAILRLAQLRPWRPAEIAAVLGFSDVGEFVHRHLSPMVAEGLLERTHPENLAHPAQAYRAASPDTDDGRQ